MKRQVPTYNITRTLPSFITTSGSTFSFTENNPGTFPTWEVEDIKVTVITQNRAVPVVGQTGKVPVGFEGALDQGNSSLNEHLDEHVSCEDWENGAIAAARKAVGVLYLGLETLAYGRKLLITGINTFKSQQSRGYTPHDCGVGVGVGEGFKHS